MNLNQRTYIQKKWQVLQRSNNGQNLGSELSSFQSTLLGNRGVLQSDQVHEFLNPAIIHDPFLLPDMKQAVVRIIEAINRKEKLAIFGDFDTDGITGTAVLAQTLKNLGAEVISYIPNRITEGHGLNKHSIKYFHSLGISVLITVDCGSTSVQEIQFAYSCGIDVIITDHHSIPDITPQALAIINHNRIDSKYPFRGLAGVGLAFKLAQAIYSELGIPYPSALLEFVALGTVADMVPLQGENRTLVHLGIKYLNSTENLGLKAMIHYSKLDKAIIDSETISFYLAPRLNAPGRLDDPLVSLKLLTTNSQIEAEKLSKQIETINNRRKEMTQTHLETARLKVASHFDHQQLIFLGEHGANPGISGLIAGNLVSDYFKPTIYYSIQENLVKGSARSIPQFNITDALSKCSDLFETYGGHSQAAGFVMKLSNLEQLENRITTVANNALKGKKLTPTINIDIEASPSQLVGETFEFLRLLGPHGQGNPMPVFLARGAEIVKVNHMGANSRHLKIRLKHQGVIWDATAFWKGKELKRLTHKMNFVYNIGVNYWMGKKHLRLNILDFKPG